MSQSINQSINQRELEASYIKSGLVKGFGVLGSDDLQVSDGYRGQSYCFHATVRINEGV